MWGLFEPSKPTWTFFQKPGFVTFLTLRCLISWKKNQKRTDYSEILHCRQTEKGGAQLVFAPRRCYVLSVAVWWYILVTLFGEIIVSQGLMQAETTVSRKASTWSKGNNDGNKKNLNNFLWYHSSPHNCYLIIVLHFSGRKFLQPGCAKK